MRDKGMLESLNLSLIPNAKLVDKVWLEKTSDPTMAHSVPYMVSFTVLGYHTEKVGEAEASWALLEREDLKGKITMLDDMRETIGAALKYLGYSANTTKDEELAAARDQVIKWKKNLAKFDNEQYKNGLASGEYALVHGYNGDLMQVANETEGIAIALPKEGFLASVDHMVIPKGSKNVELAHKFINFMHDPAVAAENTEEVQFLCPNMGAYPLLSEETRSNPAIMPSPSQMMKCEGIEDLGADIAKYSKIWDEIKAAN